MKKVLIVFLILLSINFSIYATESGYGAGSGSTVEEVGTPIQNVSLNLQDMESYAVGFSADGNPVGNDTAIQTTTLKPSAEDSTIANNAESELYIWWDIITTKKVEVKLSKTELANGDTPPAKIYWSVSGAGDVVENKVSKISIGEQASEQSFITLAASQDNTLQHISGKQKLTLTTESLDGKKVDSYNATLTLTISNPA